MALKLMYITNRPDVALIAEKYGVDRIWIDLETLGKEERQKGMNTVKSNHTVDDVRRIKPLLSTSEMLVRVNPWNENSEKEIEDVVIAGADIIMLPMWKSAAEVTKFLSVVDGRCKTTILLETKEAAECLDEVLENGGMDEIHIGLNDLHLSYGMTFMFELLANGTVEMLCGKIREKGIPYGFGGIARLGTGDLPAEKVISRSFCDVFKMNDIGKIEKVFQENMGALRAYEEKVSGMTDFKENQEEVVRNIARIVEMKKGK